MTEGVKDKPVQETIFAMFTFKHFQLVGYTGHKNPSTRLAQIRLGCLQRVAEHLLTYGTVRMLQKQSFDR